MINVMFHRYPDTGCSKINDISFGACYGHLQYWGAHFWRHRNLRGQNGGTPKKISNCLVKHFLKQLLKAITAGIHLWSRCGTLCFVYVMWHCTRTRLMGQLSDWVCCQGWGSGNPLYARGRSHHRGQSQEHSMFCFDFDRLGPTLESFRILPRNMAGL